MTQTLPAPLTAWLRRANRHPAHQRLLLSGSALIAALCPSARVPRDIDYVLTERLDEDALCQAVMDIAAIKDRSGELRIDQFIPIDYYGDADEFPGLRAWLALTDESGIDEPMAIDFTSGDPLTLEPILVPIADVGSVLAVAPESLFAWKVHALVQFSGYLYRPKDSYDIGVLWREGKLNRDALPGAIDVAFSSRLSNLDELGEFRNDEAWGTEDWRRDLWESASGSFPKPLTLLEARDEVRAILDELLGG